MPKKPTDAKIARRFAELVGLGCSQSSSVCSSRVRSCRILAELRHAPLRQWSGHSLGPPLRLGLRRPLGPGLRLEPLQSSEVVFAGASRARSAFRSRPSGPRVMHSRRRALWVPVDAPHEVFALCGPRAARPVDCRSAHSKNALNPARVAVSSRARPDSPPPQVSGAEAAAAPDTPFLTCTPTCSLAPLAVVRKTRLPTGRRS
jgi:hypothetical protein